MKMIPCSLESSMAPTPLATSPAPPQARRYCPLSLELIWRIRRKPPNETDTFRRCYTNVVYQQKYMRAGRSPVRWVVFMLPNSRPQPASSVRAINPGRLNAELTSRVCKPPDPATRAAVKRPLTRFEKGGRTGRIPVVVCVSSPPFPFSRLRQPEG